MKVIVFALNGCPTGWLGVYGNDWVGTPHLDRLASEAVTFDRHISDRPEPTAARRAWLGGTLPFGSRLREGTKTLLVRANHPDTDAPDWFYACWGEVFDARPQAEDASPLEHLLRAFPDILDRLADASDFILWIETDRLIPPWDVQQDVFEAYLEDELAPAPEEESAEPTKNGESGGDLEEAVDGEDEEPEPTTADPFPNEEPVTPFADPPTGPFDRADPDAWDWLHKTFASVVTKLDAELGGLFDYLRELGLDQSAAWLVTSDYGYPLGEHGQIGIHRPWLHEELVHLPLFLRLPGAEHAGRRVSGFTQPPDVFPTLLALFGITPPSDATGFNLLPLARGEAPSAREFASTTLELGDAAEIAIRTHDSALLVPTRVPEGDPPREPLLYEKPDDRCEVNNVRRGNIDRVDELEAKLRAEVEKREE